MNLRILGLDPGLATFGAALIAYDGHRAEVVALDCFRSAPSPKKRRLAASDDRLRRARELAAWLAVTLQTSAADVVAIESASGSRGFAQAQALGVAWGVIAAVVTRPMVQASPVEWRSAIVGKPKASETAAHEVVTRTAGAAVILASLPMSERPHALDAAGIALWSLRTDLVRALRAKEAA